MTFGATYKTSVNESETMTAAQPIYGRRGIADPILAVRPRNGRIATVAVAGNIERS
jgi:hypothetical protein